MFHNLKVRFAISHILPVLVFIPVMGILLLYLLETRYFMTNLAAELVEQGKLIAVLLQDSPTIWTDPDLAQQFVDQLQPTISSRIMLLDPQFHLLGSGFESDLTRIGQIVTADVLDPNRQNQIVWKIAYSIHMNRRIVDVAVPVFDEYGMLFGTVRLSQSVNDLIDRILPLRWLVVGTLFFAGFMAIGLSLLMARTLGLPLARLVNMVALFRPDVPLTFIPETGPDEIRALASSFNQTANRLHESELEKRDLVASVAHELGTSLGSIKAAIQAIQRGATRDPDLVVDLADGIQVQVDYLGLLVNDLSLFNETQNNDLVLKYQWVDINDLIYNQCRTHIYVITQKGISLEINIDKYLPPFRADQVRICQVLGNLLHNAYKFTPKGGKITVNVDLYHVNRQPDQIRFQIIDTGPGIASHDQQKIFEMFYRSNSVRSSYDGSGIGLALAQQLAIAHGGSLKVFSEPGQGAIFTLLVPVDPSAQKLA